MLPCIVISVVAFAIVYNVLLYFPALVYRKRRLGDKGKAVLIAHRGSRFEGLPENTIAAFLDAAKAGADIIELDVWYTKDKKVVVFHDKCLTRMTKGAVTSFVTETSYGDLPLLVPEPRQTERTSQYPPHQWQRIPLLEEVLEILPRHVSLIIEFKMYDADMVAEVDSLIEKYNRQDSVFWFSLIESINSKLAAYSPERPRITSVTTMMWILLLHYSFLLPFVPIDESVFGITLDEVPLERLRREASLASVPDWVKRVMAIVFQGSPPTITIAPNLFAHLRRRGIPVWFLGVNVEHQVDLAVAAGATAVIVDRIKWTSDYIKAKNLKFQSI